MFLENLVVDAVEPQRLGRAWEAALGSERLTDEPEGFETRIVVEGGPVLDVCFQRVPDPTSEPPRLRVQLANSGSRDDTGPLAALLLDSSDPDRDATFWSWLTGWTVADASAPRSLRHPSRRGPVLVLCPETAPKGEAKNGMHLDVRLEEGEDSDVAAAAIVERGGRELHPGWGDLPWRTYADPSGNEFCVLPAR
jgi:hypothetical protein